MKREVFFEQNMGSSADRVYPTGLNATGTPSRLINGFQYANGGPAKKEFDWIGGQSFDGRSMTGFHSIEDHGLQPGDRVHIEIVNGSQRFSGDRRVEHVGADDGSYKKSIFVIDMPKAEGETANGYWYKINTTSNLPDSNLPDIDSGGVTTAGFNSLGKVGVYLLIAGVAGTLLAFLIKKRRK